MQTSPLNTQHRLRELAALFLKLGTISFGGPAAHVAMLEDEVVRRKQWLSRDEFLDYLGATNLIPGPNSTEMAIHVGQLRAGTAGLVVAGACFILPAALIVTAIAWAYVEFGSLPIANKLLYGVKPVVIAIILQALWRLGSAAVKGSTLLFVGIASVILVMIGLNELAVLAIAGAATALLRVSVTRKTLEASSRAALGGIFAGIQSALPAQATIPTAVAVPFAFSKLFLVFLKMGAVLFGSGYVLLAFARADLVERLGWLSQRQLLDAIAVGQITPGPVFTMATFVGYVLAGGRGAFIATLGIFLPAFFFVALSHRLIPALRRSPTAGAVLDGVNVASLALMAVVTWQLARTTLVDPTTIAVAVAGTVLLARLRVNSAWLIVGGAAIGLAFGPR